MNHPLVILSQKIDWRKIEKELEGCYCPDNGRPGCSIRLLVGLHYLKHAFDESDESVVEKWVENPYWQYFCGFYYFQHECPLHPTTLVKWRQRVGSEKLKVLLQATIDTARRCGEIKRRDMETVAVDTTVQEKAIAFPTDARLYYKALNRLVKLAKRRGIKLRQSYKRKSRHFLIKQSRYAHAKQYASARKCTRKLKTYLGRVVRDIYRKALEIDEELRVYLARSDRLLKQERKSKNKLYSIDAPEVECISKGKARKRYEFGCKVSVGISASRNYVLSVQALHGNPYDGHTLSSAISDIIDNTGVSVKRVVADKGYRGHDYRGDAEIHVVKKLGKKLREGLRRLFRRRNAIEPVIPNYSEVKPPRLSAVTLSISTESR